MKILLPSIILASAVVAIWIRPVAWVGLAASLLFLGLLLRERVAGTRT